MGRASRRKHREHPIDNRGDLDRAEVAISSVLNRLKVDPRLVTHYTAWCHGRELPRLMTIPVSDAYPDLKAAAWRDLMTAVFRPPSEAERATVRQALEAVGPTRRWPRGPAADALVGRVWPHAFYTAIAPWPTQALWTTVRDDGAVLLTYGFDPAALAVGAGWIPRRGHRPQAIGHEKVRQAVETWYDAYLAHPPVPIPELTQKYAERENRSTEAHSVVYDRLELVERLLNHWKELK